MFGRVTSVLAFLFIRATGKQTYFIFKTARMALFKFIIFRLNFRYILPCRTVPNYAFCLNNAVQVEEFQLWFAQTDTVKAPYCNGGLLSEVESSRTHFEVLGLGLEGQVLGLGLEASSPRKLACPRLEDSTIF